MLPTGYSHSSCKFRRSREVVRIFSSSVCVKIRLTNAAASSNCSKLSSTSSSSRSRRESSSSSSGSFAFWKETFKVVASVCTRKSGKSTDASETK